MELVAVKELYFDDGRCVFNWKERACFDFKVHALEAGFIIQLKPVAKQQGVNSCFLFSIFFQVKKIK